MNKLQLIRYKVLDQCLRNPVGCFGIDDLVNACSKALTYERFTDVKISTRTIQGDLKDLRELYGAVLDDKLKDGHKRIYRYEDTSFSIIPQLIPNLSHEQEILKQVLDMLKDYESLPQYQWLQTLIKQRMLGDTMDGNSVIGFQNNPDLIGMEHFETLLSAILTKQPMEMVYKPYFGNQRERIVYPYYLKQYNNRWFLICKTSGFESLSNYAIDRIVSLQVANASFEPCDIDFDTYFDNVIGVSCQKDGSIEDILLRVSKQRYPYIASKPIHWSQTELKQMRTDDYHVIRLRLQISKELVSELLSFGNDLEVLSPLSLRESIFSKISDLFSKYRNNADILHS